MQLPFDILYTILYNRYMRNLNYNKPFLLKLPPIIEDKLNKERDAINSIVSPKDRITRMRLIRNILANHYKIVLK